MTDQWENASTVVSQTWRLDEALADVRANGGDPNVLAVHPNDLHRLGGEAEVRSWCNRHFIAFRPHAWMPSGEAMLARLDEIFPLDFRAPASALPADTPTETAP